MEAHYTQPQHEQPSEAVRGGGARPPIDFAKRPIPDHVQFFKYPTRIGRVLAGYSNWMLGKRSLGWKGFLSNAFYVLALTLIIGGTLPLMLGLGEWYSILLGFAAPNLIFWVSVLWIIRPKISNLYVGTDGFAVFERKGKSEKNEVEKEVRWDEVTDLYIWRRDRSFRGRYRGTTYKYYWYERNKAEIVHVMSEYQRSFQTGMHTPPRLMFAQVCEAQWTQVLLKRLEHNIQAFGHESFYLQSQIGEPQEPYIQLNHQGITFWRDGLAFAYPFEDIARIYWERENLRIQHKNFEKVLFFFRKGNENEIPMESLCNRSYFIQALGKMLNAPPNHPVFKPHQQ